MPHYSFRINDVYGRQDVEAIELPHDQAAKREAIKTAALVLMDDGPALRSVCEWSVEVNNGDQAVFTVKIRAE